MAWGGSSPNNPTCAQSTPLSLKLFMFYPRVHYALSVNALSEATSRFLVTFRHILLASSWSFFILTSRSCRHRSSVLDVFAHKPAAVEKGFRMTYFGDKAPHLAASIFALAVVAYITFGLRVYTRLHNRAWGLDDWSMTLATVSRSPWSHTAQVSLILIHIASLYRPDDIMHWRCI